MKNTLFVFLGGGIGSVLRYAISILIPWGTTGFPYATFAVNSIGSFLIGLFIAYANTENTNLSTNTTFLLFLTTGICGGFTTFSTFSKESYLFIQQQQWGLFFLYISLTLLVCIGATALGFYTKLIY